MKISPEEYANTAVIAKAVGEEMLSRLDWMTLTPKKIIDLGAGVGHTSALLKKRYPDADVIALDVSEDMMSAAKQEGQSLFTCLCADSDSLPIKSQSVDMIFANFLLPWLPDLNAFIKSCLTILQPNGLLIFSALGLDTLNEWRHLLPADKLPRLYDMHDMGDLLLHSGFEDPVLDVDYYTLTYREREKFLQELYSTQMLTSALTSEEESNLKQEAAEKIEATYEVIIAHTFKPMMKDTFPAKEGVVSIPLSQLKRPRGE